MQPVERESAASSAAARQPVPWFFDLRTFRSLMTTLLVLLALGFLYLAHNTLIVFLFAIFFAYILEPLVDRIQGRLGWGRGRAIALLYGTLLVGLGLLVLLLGPHILHQGENLARQLPSLLAKISSGQLAHQIGQEHGWSPHTQSVLHDFLVGHQADIQKIEHWFTRNAGQLAKRSWWLVLIPILAVFFLKDGHEFGQMMAELFEKRRQREFLRGLLSDLHTVLSQFIRAQLTLTLLALGVYNLGFALLRLPYPFALGTLAGLLEFIPMLGPLTAAAVVLMVAVLTGYAHILWLLIFLGLFRLMQDYYNSPHIMGHGVELHPLAVVFGVLVGGEIAGVIGVYLSIPVIASLRVVVRRWRSYQNMHLVEIPFESAPALETPTDVSGQ